MQTHCRLVYPRLQHSGTAPCKACKATLPIRWSSMPTLHHSRPATAQTHFQRYISSHPHHHNYPLFPGIKIVSSGFPHIPSTAMRPLAPPHDDRVKRKNTHPTSLRDTSKSESLHGHKQPQICPRRMLAQALACRRPLRFGGETLLKHTHRCGCTQLLLRARAGVGRGG